MFIATTAQTCFLFLSNRKYSLFVMTVEVIPAVLSPCIPALLAFHLPDPTSQPSLRISNFLVI